MSQGDRHEPPQQPTCDAVTGKYQQYIQVCLTVRPQPACSCHLEQGEIPRRIKARHWYHHFQCEEECFPPVDKAG